LTGWGDVVEFILKSGDTLSDDRAPPPPYVVQFSIEPKHIAFLRDRALVALRSAGGSGRADDTRRAERFIANAVAANTTLDTDTRERVAGALLVLCTDTPDRLSALTGGRVVQVGYVMTRERSRDLDAALKTLKPPNGGGLASALVPDGSHFRFRYVACYGDEGEG
jgi:hypothetical protein